MMLLGDKGGVFLPPKPVFLSVKSANIYPVPTMLMDTGDNTVNKSSVFQSPYSWNCDLVHTESCDL